MCEVRNVTAWQRSENERDCLMRTPAGIVAACILAAGCLTTYNAEALSLLDFNSENEGSVFFNFCVVDGTPTDTLPNSTQADLDQLVLAMAITWDGSHLLFEFVNRSADNSSISEIYMDDRDANNFGGGYVDTLLSSAGVSFVDSGAPAKLPAGNTLTPPFQNNSNLDFYATSPSSQDGVNPGENLVLAYTLYDKGTAGYDDDLAAFIGALDTGALRIGLHVQTIGAGGNSDAFVACPMEGTPPPFPPLPPVPEPATIVLLGLGTSFLMARMRFQRP